MHVFLIDSLSQGLMTSFMALGVLLTFNMMGFPDMTAEGSFPLGAAVAATLLVGGWSPPVALAGAASAGIAAGLTTGMIHTKLRVNPVLAGILTSAGIYSIEIMVMVMGAPNTSLLLEKSLYAQVLDWFGKAETNEGTIAIVGVMVAVTLTLMYAFLRTDLGLTLRATGSNETMIRGLGVSTNRTKVLALAISNMLVATAGALVAQGQGFADVGMGIGALVAAVASLILGESIIGKRSVGRWMIAVVVGSIAYRAVLNTSLRLGLPADDFKLVTSLLILAAVSIPVLQSMAKEQGTRVRESMGVLPSGSGGLASTMAQMLRRRR